MRASEITIDDVAGAYEATGLVPKAGNVQPRGGGCCALGALAAVAGVWLRDLHIEGRVSFGSGFDLAFTGQPARCTNPAEARGYEIGKALRGWKPSSKKRSS